MMQQQRGMTIWSWLFVLGTIGFITLVTLKLFPIYMENMSVKKAVNQVAGTAGAGSFNKRTAWDALSKQFYIDDVKNVEKDNVDVEIDEEGERELVVAYEVRTTMMYNVDIVVWFEERVPLKE
ncbi:MAG TPA: DUF4845 domain-containing protein [Permianibacter sp.]|nr:DUF4845 domain-containing protein [Permianibacter sp.]